MNRNGGDFYFKNYSQSFFSKKRISNLFSKGVDLVKKWNKFWLESFQTGHQLVLLPNKKYEKLFGLGTKTLQYNKNTLIGLEVKMAPPCRVNQGVNDDATSMSLFEFETTDSFGKAIEIITSFRGH